MVSKNKVCIVCGRDDQPHFSKKRCKRCASIQDAKPKKASKPIAKFTQKNKEKRVTDREGFGEFFIKHINIIKDENRQCDNCNAFLGGDVSEVAHILSKSKHLEVATNDYNVLYMCGRYSFGGCHAEFDNTLERRSKMDVFPLAAERYKLISHLIVKQSSESKQFEEYGN